MSSPRSRAPTVLVVDDFDDSRQMYAEFLKLSGITVVEAADGQAAVEQATAQQPNVIVMDLSLPVLDGWEATRRIKANPATSHIPVVALTGHALPAHFESALAAGCARFLSKPCLPDQLLATIEELLEQRKK